ncbi:MAG TPA: bifunctional phosphoribosylaminoimidazolecarboxamide formyltransferase/IMP cyclohydrolase [Chloroflexota bacterium]|nr:bifunctional phosphoribosylaminoimidazolecarboxamide formyltransferase/IMP cyclohydrolase [Chloroflexota bacterium]
MRALLSVWDKAGLAELARELVDLGWDLYSTGRTQAALQEAGLPVRGVSELTAFPEILDGRVKTLHPGVHAGLLARRDLPQHMAQLAEHGLSPIDLVVSNLYPFVETVAGMPPPVGLFGAPAAEGGEGGEGPGALPAGVQEALEQIDVGGPAMIRASAKNFPHVLIVTEQGQYAPLLEHLRRGGPAAVPLAFRSRLAQAAYAHTARYDAYVAQYFAALNGEAFPQAEALPLTRVRSLSYGENPHQQAAFYRLADSRLGGPGLADLVQLCGDEPSYNNLLDLDSAYAIVADFDQPAVAIVKHNNPCGVGTGATLEEAYRRAFAGDPLSAFGGVVAFNRDVDEATVRATRGTMYPVMVAPAFSEEGLQAVRRYKKPTPRTFALPLLRREQAALPGFGLHYRPVAGGFLAQTADAVPLSEVTFTVVSKRPPTEAELRDLRFAWRVVKHVRSNACVFARDEAVVAVGAGQMSRVDAVVAATHVARRSAPEGSALPAEGSVMATDGFFPFPDAVEATAAAGCTAIAHPGGAKQDAAAIEAADRLGLAMVVTGYRHFRH